MKKALPLILVAIVVGASGFFGGLTYAKSKAPKADKNAASGQQQQGGGRQGGGEGGGFRGGPNGGGAPVAGEILSKDDTSVTLKLPSGGSKIILLSGNVKITKTVDASASDLAAGTFITVMGKANADGSVAAQSIQIRPAPPAVTPTNQPSADAKEYVVTGSNFAMTPSAITVKKGQKTRIVFKNMDGLHDLKIDEFNVATQRIQGGQQDIVEFTPDKTGSFQYYCSVGTHRAMGMWGTLTVTE